MNNLLLLGLGVLVLFLVMNGSKGKGKSKSGSLSKSVSKAFKGNSVLIIVAVGAVVLFMCMNKGLVEGTGTGTHDDDTPPVATPADDTAAEQVKNSQFAMEAWCKRYTNTSDQKYCGQGLCLVNHFRNEQGKLHELLMEWLAADPKGGELESETFNDAINKCVLNKTL